MPIKDARELFVHELEDMVSSEHIIVKMLPVLQKEANDPEAKTVFREHETETKAQIKRLEQVFELLGEKPESATCYATEGLKKEHDALHEEKPTPEMLAMAGLVGAAKTEHYEIASYDALVQMAKDLGEREVADLLQQTLTEEKEMAKRVTALAKAAGKAAKSEAQAD
jgi:ferritin-like metal-binding protein YciE